MSNRFVSPTFRPRISRPRAVYIHIPFCRHRCGYCNFTLVAGRDYLVDRFLDALAIEIGWLDDSYEVDTVFYGGGTPSHLSAQNMKRLNSIVRSRFSMAESCEVTAECNPSDLTETCATALAECGVNRVSLGVQSLNATKLKILERDHTYDVVNQAVSNARSFAKSVSLDLIFAAPHETLDQWKSDLDDAIAFAPDHFSTYELTYEKGARFWARHERHELISADEDVRCQMYEHTIDTLAKHGYQQYEISSFAKKHHECRHNNVYWSGVPYFAFGPGASRYVDGIRQTNHQSTTRYIQLIEASQSPIAQSERLSPEESARELLSIALRRLEGVSLEWFETQTGYKATELLSNFRSSLETANLIHVDDTSIRLTRNGILVCDRIASEILN